MMVVIRDKNSAVQGLYNGKKAQEELGIPTQFIDIEHHQELIKKMPEAIQVINDHLVDQFNVQGGLNKPTAPGADPAAAKTWGKILVFCDSGNERSPAVVTAYLMAMYDMDLISALQYIQQQRFCVCVPLKMQWSSSRDFADTSS